MNAKTIQHFYSEFLGTFALVFIGSGTLLAIAGGSGGMIEAALAHGLILGIMVTAFMRIAAHFNPAVTIGFLFTRRITPALAGIHIVAQVLGAIAAAYLLKGLFPASIFSAGHGGMQSISPDVGGVQAWFAEAVATFFLMTAIYGTAVDNKSPRIGGFAIGLTIAADIMAIGPLTGGSMNPARSLGPALAYGSHEAIAIYLTAPVVGAIVAALAYEKLILSGDPPATT